MMKCPCGAIYCKECDVCHSCGEVMSEWKAPTQIKLPANLKPITQKGRGVVALREWGYNIPYLTGFVRDEDSLAAAMGSYPKLFARPCPKTPRHGFVDSRVISSIEELRTVLAETLAADPDGEVMVMSPLVGDKLWNAVLTPSLLTVGAGNDGATNGTDTVSFPLSSQLPSQLLKDAGIPADQDPYVELVGDPYGSVWWTQLRSGPRLGAVTRNFIPSPIVVEHVLCAGTQPLLEWERIIEASRDVLGLVVYHPGGSLTDHWTVHARSWNIPVILDGPMPQKGDKLEPEGDSTQPDPVAVLKGIIAGSRLKLPVEAQDKNPAINLMLLGLYSAPRLGGSFGGWLGLAAAIMLRYGSLALNGEVRHFEGYSAKHGKPERTTVYKRALSYSLSRHRARLNRLINLLRYGFSGNSIGGEKWGRCGYALIPLFNAVRNLARDPSPDQVGEIIRALNKAVDQAHNNGWWLNKFTTDGNVYQRIQAGELKQILPVCHKILEWGKLIQSLDPATYSNSLKEIAAWPDTKFVPITISKAETASLPPFPGMVVTIRAKLLGAKMTKSLVVPQKVMERDGVNSAAYYVVKTPTGLGLEARAGGGAEIVWSEDTLDKGRED